MSFTDLMSSGRGPGVIGMIFALIVLLGFGCLSIFAFDPGMQGADQSIESLIASQEKDIEQLREAISVREERLAAIPELQERERQLAIVSRENLYRKDLIASLKDGVDVDKGKVAAKMLEFEAYKDDYRSSVRGRAKGSKIDKLVIKSGKSYNNVLVRKVTAVGMQIQHDGGHVRIDYEELPDDLQDYYQFDPDQKLAALNSERDNRARLNKAVATAQQAEAEKLAEIRAQEAEKNQYIKRQKLAEMENQIRPLERQIDEMERMIRMEKNKKGLRRVPQMVESLNGMRTRLNDLHSEIARLQAEIH